ncbi:MAG: hypothetical protein UY21_C0015G0016 [Microgenomates group bacterium GW2011_GWA1_48_10]|nr:MAG: hypothetical protein UY21_C0015G0016 [Microgenomates group bacterium GW2011_GWA1_48_10]
MTTYRGQIIFGSLRHLTVVIMAVILWGTIFRGKQSVGGFDLGQIVTYYILVELIDIFYMTASARVLTRDINTGDLSNYLVKPINYWNYLLFYSYGNQLGYVSLGIVILLVASRILPSLFFVQTNIIFIIQTALLLSVSSMLYFQIFFLIGAMTFWLSDSSHFRSGVKQLIGVLGGRWAPLAFFPLWAQEILNYTPFPYLFNFVVKAYQGGLKPTEFLNLFCIELLWLGALLFVGRIVWKKGMISYASFGK